MERVCKWSGVVAGVGTFPVYPDAIHGRGIDHVCVARWLRADPGAQTVAARHSNRSQAGCRANIRLAALRVSLRGTPDHQSSNVFVASRMTVVAPDCVLPARSCRLKGSMQHHLI